MYPSTTKIEAYTSYQESVPKLDSPSLCVFVLGPHVYRQLTWQGNKDNNSYVRSDTDQ